MASIVLCRMQLVIKAELLGQFSENIIEFKVGMSNYIPLFYMNAITYPY